VMRKLRRSGRGFSGCQRRSSSGSKSVCRIYEFILLEPLSAEPSRINRILF
jgi:hypothetical protein